MYRISKRTYNNDTIKYIVEEKIYGNKFEILYNENGEEIEFNTFDEALNYINLLGTMETFELKIIKEEPLITLY